MKNKIAVIALILIAVPLFTFAQTSPSPAAAVNPCSPQAVQGGSNDRINALPRCVNKIYVWSLGVAVLLALLMMVLGGYYLMTAAGNAEQASKGKEYITGALIGVVILFSAYLLLREINPDLVNFNLDSITKIQDTPTPSTIRGGTGTEGSPLDPAGTGCVFQCDPQ